MKLYLAKKTISIVVAIALEEAGLAYEPVELDFTGGAQTKPGYLAINPKGRVPALEVPGGVLTETAAILDYIGALAPKAGLVPQDPLQAARMREAMCYVGSTMHVNHAHKLRGARWADLAESHADMRAKVPQTMAACCAHVEAAVLQGSYVLGDAFSLADPYLYVVSTWLAGDGVEIGDYPKLSAFNARMAERPSVAAMRARGWL
ncbi:glutathione S-transferase family protein [Pseudorhodobacter sp.]|uniref:glutathione S-transferase family protein n=1 Tax=Pseudorhodobacter sp. TaxID=1934400 RepID=UPI002649934D|nr:glutathione S-transferase family protein [Pseudorhodobacter sp.]MDN5787141.1 glutathione S-transferase family protein [Pseudorhodobacter sp.]